jgi:uncharacterized Zn-binding protein involved in type VI secretion
MSEPSAKQGDRIVGTDSHVLMVPSPGGPVPTPTKMPFDGPLDGDLSPDVRIERKAAAVVGSTATNTPAHVPTAGPFQRQPKNQATVIAGSGTVRINKKPAARNGDLANTCNDPVDAPNGKVVAKATVRCG